MSKQDSKVAGKKRSASQDGREEILALLGNDATTIGKLNIALILDDQGHPKLAEQVYGGAANEKRDTKTGRSSRLILSRENILHSTAIKLIPLLSLQTAGTLALVWRDQGKYDMAFDKICDILGKETCSPYQDAMHLRLITILAIILRDRGDHDMSLFLIRNALRVSDELYGNKDPFTLDLASELSQILTEQNNYGLAEQFARRAFNGFADQFGTDHPQSLNASSRLATAMLFDERLGDATILFERTLKAQKSQLGSTHPDTVPTKRGLAASYALGARFRDAVSILRPTLDQQSALFGQNPHPDTEWTLQALDRVAGFQQALGKCEKTIQEASKNMRVFFKTPFRRAQIKWKLGDDITVHKNAIPLNLDKASIPGIHGTTLHRACFVGDLPSVQKLLDTETDSNAQGGIFSTPLRAASYSGHINIISSLLAHGANAKDGHKHGHSALQLALSMGHQTIADKLLNAGANLADTDHWYGNSLHEATMTGQEHVVDFLLRKGNAKVNAVTGIFGTALGAAAWKGNLDVMRELVAKGAMVDSEVEGRTAIDMVASRGHWGIMEALKGAATNGNGNLKSKGESKFLEYRD